MYVSTKAPVHLWIVGVVSALWNAFGALDYTMTQIGNAAWLAQMTEEQRLWLAQASPLLHATWALGVWGALIGSLLLLARSRHAVPAFAVSLLGLAGNTLLQLTGTPSPHMEGQGAILFHLVIWGIAILLLVYAIRMRGRGVLR